MTSGGHNRVSFKHSEASKKKIREAGLGRVPWNKGRGMPKETAKKISKSLKGNLNRKGKRGSTSWNKGKKETRKRVLEKMRLSHLGKKSNLWKGGIANRPYGKEFNNELKEEIRKRDNYKCQGCLKPQSRLSLKSRNGDIVPLSLGIHHIDCNKKNNIPDNLISLCKSCHAKAHFKKADWIKYFRRKIKHERYKRHKKVRIN